MRVLVTGGAGLHRLARGRPARRRDGHEPRIFDLVPSPHHGPEIETRARRPLRPGRTRAAIDGCDAVVHLAAMADVDEVANDPARTDRVNVARHAGRCSRRRATRASSGSSTRARSGSTATRPDPSRSTRTRRSACRSTSTPRRRSRARCTRRPTASSTGSSGRSSASGSRTARVRGRPQSSPRSRRRRSRASR